MSGETNLQKLLASMKPFLSEDSFVFGTLTAYSAELLGQLQPIGTFHEAEGLTVILLKTLADKHQISYSGVFKCITLSVHSSLSAVGLTAAVSSKLASVNISANVVAAYYHDHIFIAENDADKALFALNELVRDGV